MDLAGHKTDFFNVSYDVLARTGVIGQWHFEQLGVGRYPIGASPYTSWISTYNNTEANILEVTPKHWGSPASLVADLVLTGHPDKDGKRRVNLPVEDQQRIYTWIDLNVPYYGTSESAYYDRKGCRRLYPENLDSVLAEVANRRCNSCHNDGIPRKHYTRILEPHENSFLFAPLARAAGGTEACGKAVFASKNDPDYRAIVETFGAIRQQVGAPSADGHAGGTQFVRFEVCRSAGPLIGCPMGSISCIHNAGLPGLACCHSAYSVRTFPCGC